MACRTHERTIGISRPLVGFQHVFHGGDEARIGFRRDHTEIQKNTTNSLTLATSTEVRALRILRRILRYWEGPIDSELLIVVTNATSRLRRVSYRYQAICWGIGSDIDDDVPDGAFETTHDFHLAVRLALIVVDSACLVSCPCARNTKCCAADSLSRAHGPRTRQCKTFWRNIRGCHAPAPIESAMRPGAASDEIA